MILDDEDILIQSAADSAHYEMVDLGLSVKWANKNVGASHPEDIGWYFQWGDTVGYTADQVSVDKVFNWDNYKFGTYLNLAKYNSIDKLTVLESEDDAATVYMGSDYRIPTIDEIQELIENTTQIFIDIDGNEYIKSTDTINIERGKLKGVRFMSSNGNSIFIPAAGGCGEFLLSEVNMNGILWSSSLRDSDNKNPKVLFFDYYGFISDSYYNYRYYAYPIRGVE